MKSASIFFQKNHIIIHALSKTEAGFWMSSEPYIKLKKESTPQEIISSLLNALDKSKNKVNDPINWSDSNKEFLKNLGLKSLKQLETSETKYCSIHLNDSDVLTFTPTKHAKPPDKGFLHKPQEEAVKINGSAAPTDIFKALQLAFDKCE